MKKRYAYAYDENDLPFNKWKATDKFAYIFNEDYPDIWKHVAKEFRFDTVRKWRLDYAWPVVLIGVEIHGFGWGHQAQQHQSGDNEKANKAVELGWSLFTYNSRDLGSRAKIRAAVSQVAEFIQRAAPHD